MLNSDLIQKEESYWCKVEPNLQRAWSPSSLTLIQDCPRKYYYSRIEGWRSPIGPAILFGSHLHSALEVFDRALCADTPWEDATRSATQVALMLGHELDQFDGDSTRTRLTLVRAVVWYALQFRADAVKVLTLHDGSPAIELHFKLALPLTNPDGESYILHGYIDSLVSYGENFLVKDRKTTKSTLGDYYFKQWSPNAQVSAYTLGAQTIMNASFDGVMIEAFQTAVGFTRIQRGFAHRSKGQLDEWLTDVLKWIEAAERYVEEGHWPMNTSSCMKYGGCPFQEVCSKDPSVRGAFLSANFEQDRPMLIDKRKPA